MENLYDILEVSKKASKEIIEKAYKTLAKKYHPDVQTPENKSNAEEMMKKINEAYSVLSDEQKRIEYDKKLSEQEYNHNENVYNATENNNVNFDNWQEAYSKLNRREKSKVQKKIEKEANEEIKRQYQSFLRSLGYKIKHKWTFKDFITLAIVIMVLISIFMILWWIPETHNWMIEIYNNNLVVRIIVNIIIGIYKGIIQFFSNIFNF